MILQKIKRVQDEKNRRKPFPGYVVHMAIVICRNTNAADEAVDMRNDEPNELYVKVEIKSLPRSTLTSNHTVTLNRMATMPCLRTSNSLILLLRATKPGGFNFVLCYTFFALFIPFLHYLYSFLHHYVIYKFFYQLYDVIAKKG